MDQAPKTCPSCGEELSAEAPLGLCPRCLLKTAMEAAGGRHLHVRCPHCQHAIELVDDSPVVDLICPACDTGFSLVGDATVTYTGERPASIGRFELLERLGVGAFGSVWKARDPELDRLVAVKIPRKGQLAPDEVEKFLREARSAAQLRHPNIVAVHEVGRDHETVFIVSELVEGVTLADRLTGDRPEPLESARLAETIARALKHAHAAGVIHRDLKPSNIILDAAGEPHVTDFGLAKRAAGEVTMTLDGQVLGTPAYMSPEQAKGEGHDADARSDVYSLGVVLFELLTGEKPFRGNTRMLLHQVIHDDPPPPRRLNAAVPRDLETITLQCLQKDPRRRYQMAGDLAVDLSHARRGEPIRARPETRVEHAMRWCRRNPLPASLGAALVLVFIAAFITVTTAWLDARSQRKFAQEQANMAEQREKESRSRLVRHYVGEGSRAIRDGEPLRAAVWFAEAYHQDSAQPSADDHEMHQRRLGTIWQQVPRMMYGFFRDGEVDGARYSPDGRRIAIHLDHTLEIIDAATGRTVGAPQVMGEFIWQAFFSPNSQLVAVIALSPSPPGDGDYEGFVAVFDAETAKPMFRPKKLRTLNGWNHRFSPDSRRLFIVAGDDIHIFDAATGGVALPPLRQPDIGGMAFSPEGRRFVVWHHTMEVASDVRLYDAETCRPIGEPKNDVQIAPGTRDADVFSPDGRVFATYKYDYTGGRGSGPSTLQLWNSETGEPAVPEIATTYNVERTAFSRDSSIVFAHLRNGKIPGWRTANGQQESLHGRLDDRVDQFALSPDGARFAVSQRGAGRCRLTVFNAWTNYGWIIYEGEFTGVIDQLEFSPDGQRLLVAAAGVEAKRGLIHLVDLNSRDISTVSVVHQYGWLRAELDPHGQRLLTYGEDGSARVWDVTRLGPTLAPIEGLQERGVSCLRVSPSGRLLAVGQGHLDIAVERGGGEPYGLLRMWDLKSGRPEGPEIQFGSRVTQVTFDRNERTALVTLSYGSVAVVDIAQGRVIRTIQLSGEDRILAAAWQRDGGISVYVTTHIVEGNYLNERGIRVETWPDRAAEKPDSAVPIEKHTLLIFSPDAERYLFVTPDRSAGIHDVSTGKRLVSFGRLHGEPDTAVFSPDGGRVAIVFKDRILEQWNTHSGTLAAPLIRHVFDSSASPGSDEAPVRFSNDGRLLLVRMDEYTSQVFDAATSEPLSLPMATQRFSGSPYEEVMPVFGPGGETLISTAGDSLRIWNIAREQHLASHWISWSQLADGHYIDAVGGYTAAQTGVLGKTWEVFPTQQLLAGNRDGLERTDAWHVREARLQEFVAGHGPNDPATDAGHWFAARFHLDALIAQSPNDVGLRKRRGHATVAIFTNQKDAGIDGDLTDRQRRLKEAVDDCTLAIDGGLAQDSQIWFDRGVARHAIHPQHEEAAKKDIAHAVELGFQYAPPELAAWQKPAVIEGLNRLITSQPTNDTFIQQRAQLHWDIEAWQAGVEDYTRLIKADPDDYWSHYRRADCYLGLGRWQEAIEDYTIALSQQRDDPNMLEMRAGAFALGGRHDEASADLVRARQLLSYPFDILFHEAIVRLMADDQPGYRRVCAEIMARAHELYNKEKLIANIPDETAATIAWTCSLGPNAIDDYATVMALAEKASQSRWNDDPDGRIGKRTQGAVLFRAGREAEAIAPLKAAEPLKDAVEIKLLLALVHAKLGQTQDARTAFDQATSQINSGPIRRPWSETATIQILKREVERSLGNDAAPKKAPH